MCYVGKLVYFSQGRNAWEGRWSRTYTREEAFCPDLKSATAKIERQRVQGSQWHIAELPVLVLAGVEDSLLVTEINTREPLSRFLRSRTYPRSLEEAGGQFEPDRPNSVIRIISSSSLVPPAPLPFLTHASVSRSGHVPLQWSRSSASVQSIDPILRIATRITKSLQRERRR